MNGRGLVVLISIAASQLGLVRASAEELGVASVYATQSRGRAANGENLNPNAFTAAHRTFPFGTHVLVTNKKNGRSVTVTITDRGPFVRGRIIDVTPAAARELGFSGLTQVSVQAVNERPVIPAVPISHHDGPALVPSERVISIAATPEDPDGSAKPADAESAADTAPASVVAESPTPGVSVKKVRTRSSYVQRRDRSAYSLSTSYMQYYYQVGYTRAWWPGLGRHVSGKDGRQTVRATTWPF
jgi:rare lipoprotein A